MNTIGIIGAGQLGQMLGDAASRLGLKCIFLDPSDSPPATRCGEVRQAAFDDTQALDALARDCDVITYEFENVPVSAVREIDSATEVLPPPNALQHSQDRLAEKRLFESLNIPIPPYRQIDSAADLESAADELGLPLLVKTRRLGYDGKGQAIFRSRAEAASVAGELGTRELIAEQFVNFDREVSAIGARSASGHIVTYPLSENEHADGILRISRSCLEGDALAHQANEYLDRLLTQLRYVGVLALELFVVGDRLLANEFAPRVHNSGHWTIEGTDASQFENHIRAVTGMPLADPQLQGYAGMVNILGAMPDTQPSEVVPAATLHDYGKTERPGRKLAHVTVVASSAAERDANLVKIQATLTK